MVVRDHTLKEKDYKGHWATAAHADCPCRPCFNCHDCYEVKSIYDQNGEWVENRKISKFMCATLYNRECKSQKPTHLFGRGAGTPCKRCGAVLNPYEFSTAQMNQRLVRYLPSGIPNQIRCYRAVTSYFIHFIGRYRKHGENFITVQIPTNPDYMVGRIFCSEQAILHFPKTIAPWISIEFNEMTPEARDVVITMYKSLWQLI